MSRGLPQEVRQHYSYKPTTVLLLHTRTMDELLLEG